MSSSTAMATALLLALALAVLAPTSEGAWCVCNQQASPQALQKTIDYACGAGADCGPIIDKGPCFQPNNVVAHCSYAANSYFQRHGQAQQACDFSGTATISTTDPSTSGCSYPATASAAGTGTGTTGTPNTSPTTNPGGSTLTPGTGTGTGTGSTSTGTLTPGSTSTGTGGVFGMAPSGSGTGLDSSGAAAAGGPFQATAILGFVLVLGWAVLSWN